MVDLKAVMTLQHEAKRIGGDIAELSRQVDACRSDIGKLTGRPG
jgi:hypothetical protein